MAEFGKWIVVKWRDLTEEEKQFYSNGDITHISDFELPAEGEEILISRNNGKWVSIVEFCNDSGHGIGDDYGNDWIEEVDAWMPLPKGYVKENNNG